MTSSPLLNIDMHSEQYDRVIFIRVFHRVVYVNYYVFLSPSITTNSLINKQLKARVYRCKSGFNLLIIHATYLGHI
jgi:hypothetical protein